MNKKLFSFAMVVGLCLLATAASAVTLCDGFGRTWDLTVSTCSSCGNGKCLDGVRDVNNDLGCGPVTTVGCLSNGAFSVATVYDSAQPGGCVSVQWRGTVGGGGVSGDWTNPFGTGTWDASVGACRVAGDTGFDPSR